MFQRLTIYKIAFANVLIAVSLLLLWANPLFVLAIKIAACLMNASFLLISLHNISRFLKRNGERLFIGRKRTLIVLMSSVYIFILLFSAYYRLSIRDFSILCVSWTVLMFIVHLFANPISVFLHAKSCYDSARLTRHEGRFANVTDVGEDAVAAECAETCACEADGEVVWACRPDAGGKFVERRKPIADDGDTKAESHQGEHV